MKPPTMIDPNKILPLIECRWWECGAYTKGKLAVARVQLRAYVAQEKTLRVASGIAGLAAGLVLGISVTLLVRGGTAMPKGKKTKPRFWLYALGGGAAIVLAWALFKKRDSGVVLPYSEEMQPITGGIVDIPPEDNQPPPPGTSTGLPFSGENFAFPGGGVGEGAGSVVTTPPATETISVTDMGSRTRDEIRGGAPKIMPTFSLYEPTT